MAGLGTRLLIASGNAEPPPISSIYYYVISGGGYGGDGGWDGVEKNTGGGGGGGSTKGTSGSSYGGGGGGGTWWTTNTISRGLGGKNGAVILKYRAVYDPLQIISGTGYSIQIGDGFRWYIITSGTVVVQIP